jgi:hypothetical protein
MDMDVNVLPDPSLRLRLRIHIIISFVQSSMDLPQILGGVREMRQDHLSPFPVMLLLRQKRRPIRALSEKNNQLVSSRTTFESGSGAACRMSFEGGRLQYPSTHRSTPPYLSTIK